VKGGAAAGSRWIETYSAPDVLHKPVLRAVTEIMGKPCKVEDSLGSTKEQ
jgi:hypothetical protein